MPTPLRTILSILVLIWLLLSPRLLSPSNPANQDQYLHYQNAITSSPPPPPPPQPQSASPLPQGSFALPKVYLGKHAAAAAPAGGIWWCELPTVTTDPVESNAPVVVVLAAWVLALLLLPLAVGAVRRTLSHRRVGTEEMAASIFGGSNAGGDGGELPRRKGNTKANQQPPKGLAAEAGAKDAEGNEEMLSWETLLGGNVDGNGESSRTSKRPRRNAMGATDLPAWEGPEPGHNHRHHDLANDDAVETDDDDDGDAMQLDESPHHHHPAHHHRHHQPHLPPSPPNSNRSPSPSTSSSDRSWHKEWLWPPSSPSSPSTISNSSSFTSIHLTTVPRPRPHPSPATPEPLDPTGAFILGSDLPPPPTPLAAAAVAGVAPHQQRHLRHRRETRKVSRGVEVVRDETNTCPRVYRAPRPQKDDEDKEGQHVAMRGDGTGSGQGKGKARAKDEHKTKKKSSSSVAEKEERMRRGSWRNVFGRKNKKTTTEKKNEDEDEDAEEEQGSSMQGVVAGSAVAVEDNGLLRRRTRMGISPGGMNESKGKGKRKATTDADREDEDVLMAAEDMDLDRVDDSDEDLHHPQHHQQQREDRMRPNPDSLMDEAGPSETRKRKMTPAEEVEERAIRDARRRFSARLAAKGFRRFGD